MNLLPERKPKLDTAWELYEEFAYEAELGTERQTLVPRMQEELAESPLSGLLSSINRGLRDGKSLGESITRTLREKNRFAELLIDAAATPEETAATFGLLASLNRRKQSVASLYFSIPSMVALVVVVVVVVSIILAFVVPQFEALFQDFGADLPAFTRLVIELSNWVVEWWWFVAGAVVALVLSYKLSSEMRLLAGRLILRLPVVGRYFSETDLNEFLHRALALRDLEFLSAKQALMISRERVRNPYLQRALRDVSDDSAFNVLINGADVFSSRIKRIASRARSDHQLCVDLGNYVRIASERLQVKGVHLSQYLDIAIKVVLFSLVGLIVIALYLPIFSMGSII